MTVSQARVTFPYKKLSPPHHTFGSEYSDLLYLDGGFVTLLNVGDTVGLVVGELLGSGVVGEFVGL